MTKQEAIDKASRRYKAAKMRRIQRVYGADAMDDVAVALNARPTFDEIKETEFWFKLFQDLEIIPKDIT